MSVPDENRLLLVTNNLNAKDAFGQPSHVWIIHLLQEMDDPEGGYCGYSDDDLIENITHWRYLDEALDADKLTWQVRDTCMRAERAEGALRLCQAALRRWTDLYAKLQNESGERVSRVLDYNLPPGDHVRALEAIEEHFKAGGERPIPDYQDYASGAAGIPGSHEDEPK